MLLIPLWVLEQHGSAFAIGLDVAAVSVAPMILAIPIGAAADRLGSRRIVLIGAISAAIATVLSISIDNVWLFGFWQMIAGLGRSSTWIGAQAAITTEKSQGDRRAKRIGFLSLSAQIGNLGGPFLAGLLVAKVSSSAAFLVAAVAIAAISFSIPASTRTVGVPASPSSGELIAPQEISNNGRNFTRAFKLLRIPDFRLMIFASIIRLWLIAIRNSFYVVYLHHLGWSAVNIGLVLSLGSAASAITAALAGPLYSRFSVEKLLVVSVFGMAAVFGVIPFSSSFAIQVVSLVLFGVGNGISQTMLISLLAKATPKRDRGLAVGFRTSINRAVQFTAPLAFGVLVGVVVLPTLIFALSLVSAASLASVVWKIRGA